jgi:hypothetical protein
MPLYRLEATVDLQDLSDVLGLVTSAAGRRQLLMYILLYSATSLWRSVGQLTTSRTCLHRQAMNQC